MRFLVASILAFAAFAGLVQAQADLAQKILKETPECSAECITPLFLDGTCDIGSIADCICSNTTIQSQLSSCVQTSCPFADQITAVTVEASLCKGYPKESRSADVRLAAILCTAFILPIIFLRFYARLSTVGGLGVDDYMTIVALLAHLAVSGIEIASASMGFGMHYWHVHPGNASTLLQLFWIVQMLYIVIQTFTKLAIVFFLRHIFSTHGFRLATNIFTAFLVTTCIAFVFVDAFQCTPVRAVWDRYLERGDRQCLNITTAGYVLAAVNIFQDLVLLVLPIPWVMSLQLTLRKRILIASLFGIGSFACVTSMIRMRYLVKFSSSLDSTWDNVDVVIWSIIEGFSALLCGSLPTIWPLVKPFFAPVVAWTTKLADGSKKSKTTENNSSYHMRPLTKSSRNFTELNDSDHMFQSGQQKEEGLPRAHSPKSGSDSEDYLPKQTYGHTVQIKSMA